MGCSGVAVFFIWLVNRKSDILILSCVFSGLSIGGWNALDVLGPELYPTHLRYQALLAKLNARLLHFSPLNDVYFGFYFDIQITLLPLLQ